MIIFYNKKTSKIFGTIEGRIHDEELVKTGMIKPGDVKKKDVGKYVVPFKTLYKIVEVPVKEMRIVDEKTRRVEEFVVGKKKDKVGIGMTPDVPFAKLILDFESGKESIYNYKVKLDNKEKVIGFEKKKFNMIK